jgi:hypothetical protein
MTIFIKFNEKGHSVEMTNSNPNSTEYVELGDDFMGKQLLKSGDTVRVMTELEIEEMLKEASLVAQAIAVKNMANTLLKQSEALALPDAWSSYTDAQKSKVTDYRDFLRKVETQKGFPLEIVWPELPNLGV